MTAIQKNISAEDRKGDRVMKLKQIGACIMRSLAVIACALAYIFAVSSPVSAATQWNVGISGGSGGIDGFHLSIGEYYRVPEREVIVIRERGIDDEELPVVFFIAECAHVSPDVVVRYRLRGMSWMDITLHFGLSPEIYYVPVGHGHPYGHAYGYYKNHPRKDWGRMHFKDRDIVNQVNLKFISEHRKYAPETIMKYRSEGRRFADIDRSIGSERHGKVSYNNDRRDDKKDRNGNRQERPNQGHGNAGGRHR